jgi:hypothetical protein
VTPLPQGLDGLQDFLDAHGADPRRWPVGMEEALAPWFARDPRAGAMLARARKLEALIEAAAAPSAAYDPAIARIVARAAQATPLRPKQAAAGRQATPLRPILALAASLILGFFVGANGWMPGARTTGLDVAEIAALAADSFVLEEAL